MIRSRKLHVIWNRALSTTVSDFRSYSVLVLEDNPYERNLMVGILKAFQVGNVVDCSNVDDAISELHNLTFNCAIVDWMLKGKNGIEFVRYVRKHSTSVPSDLPIIICTGFTDLKHIVLARDSGVNEIIAKPFSVEEVYRKLYAAIFRRRQWIVTKTFVGPDRRRQDRAFKGPDRRGKMGLSQNQIDDLVNDVWTKT